MKSILLGTLFSFLVMSGTAGFIFLWVTPDVPLWMDVLLRVPLACAIIWMFRMVYDIWIKALPPKVVPKFTESPHVELAVGAPIYINGVLYRYVEISSTAESWDVSSRIILESVDTRQGFIHTVPRPPADGM